MFGTINALFGSDKPDLKLQTFVKNKPIQEQLDFGIDRSAETQKLAESSIKGFMDTFRANQPRIESMTEGDISRIGDIYSGKLETQLGGLRDVQRRARLGATESALSRARGAETARAAASGLPGGSSYRNLMEARVMNDIMTQAALEDAAMQRGDFNTLQQLQLSNLGTRQNMLQGLEQRQSVPLRATAEMRGIPMQNLAQLQQMDEANKIYNMYRQRGTLERLSDAQQASMAEIGQLVDLAGSVGGMVAGFGGMGGLGGLGGGGGGGNAAPPVPTGAATASIPQVQRSSGAAMMMPNAQAYWNPTPIPSYNPGYGYGGAVPSIPAHAGYSAGMMY